MYHKALKIDPHSAIILKNLGTNLLAEHKYNKGWEAYKQAVAIDPQIFADHTGPSVENPSNVQERGAMNYYMARAARAPATPTALLSIFAGRWMRDLLPARRSHPTASLPACAAIPPSSS